MPQAMEWSLATPMIRPRLPAINPAMIPPSPPLLSFETLKGEAGVGATEPETVGHHAVELNVLFHRADDRHALGLGIEVLDVGGGGDEAVVHHQQGIDGLVHTGHALGMPGQRLGGRDPWHVGAEGPPDPFLTGDVAYRRGRSVRISILRWRVD